MGPTVNAVCRSTGIKAAQWLFLQIGVCPINCLPNKMEMKINGPNSEQWPLFVDQLELKQLNDCFSK